VRRTLLAALSAAAAAVTIGAALPALAVTGPDTSSFQHPNGIAIAWGQVASAGQSFAFIKATEATTYTNPYYAKDAAGAAAAGLMHGAYDFARPALPLSTATDQARYFFSVAGSQEAPGDLPPVLDLEVTGGLSTSQLVSWTNTWLTTIKQLTGRTPILYSYLNFWTTAMGDTHAFLAYPLWIADYGVAKPTVPGGWPTYTFWQFTDSASIRGISGGVDASYFNGTLDALRRLALEDSGAAPFGVSAAAGDATAQVWWNALPTATGYTLTGTDGTTYPEAAGVTSQSITGLTNGQAYAYSVTANLPNGKSEVTGWGVPVVPVVPDRITLTATPGQLYAGNQTTVAVQVTQTATGQPISGLPVNIYGQWVGSNGPYQVQQLTTDAQGQASFQHTVGLSDAYQADILGSPYAYTQPATGWVPVSVLPTMTASPSATDVTVGRWFSVTGSVNPSRGGDPLTVQAYIAGSWHNVAAGTGNSTGAYSLPVYAGRLGQFPIRVLLGANTVHASGNSATFDVDVSPSTTVAVSAHPSAGSAPVGSRITVSGTVSPSEGGDPLQVQALLDGTWHDVATPSAGPSGGYAGSVYLGRVGQFPFRVLVGATPLHPAGSSPTFTVSVDRIVGAVVSARPNTSAPRVGTRIDVTGSVSPARYGDHLLVQAWITGMWHNVGWATTNQNGQYAATVYCGRTGSIPIRVSVSADPIHYAAVSPTFVITVH